MNNNSKCSLFIKDLETVEEEEEVQMIIDLNPKTPSVDPHEDARRNTIYPLQEEDALHWRNQPVCHCASCFSELIEKLPQIPRAMEITRSQSLHNFHDPSNMTSAPIAFKHIPSNAARLIRTREKNTLESVTFGEEILRFQGRVYTPEDIAPTWKKDCRTWLWKSVGASRRSS